MLPREPKWACWEELQQAGQKVFRNYHDGLFATADVRLEPLHHHFVALWLMTTIPLVSPA